MRILVTGAKGMLGSVLVPYLDAGNQVTGVDIEDFDICDSSAVRKALVELRPEFVYHLAAFVDVDGSEAKPQLAAEINSLGTRHIATVCAEIGAVLLFVSTDYVFDGSSDRPYHEEDCPHPMSAYGHSKLKGEQYVQAVVARHFIVRTAWLYGLRRKNFVATILKLAKAGGDLRVVSDQSGSPTYASHLAKTLAEFSRITSYGIYHATGSGSCSWFEFAQAILKAGGYHGVRVIPISTRESDRPARRPANSVLENRRLVQNGLAAPPHWSVGLTDYLEAAQHSGESSAWEPASQSRTVGPGVSAI